MTLVYPQIVTGADLLRGIIKLDELAPLLKRRGARAVGIVNSKMYGVRSFTKVMKKYDIHAVIGLSITLELPDEREVLLYVYAKDDSGYKNLLKISSASSIRNQETFPLKWLQAYSAGCVFVCPMTDASWDGLRNSETVKLLQDACQTIFIGISRPGGQVHSEEQVITAIAKEIGAPICAVQEARYIHREEAFTYEIATAIRLGYKLNEPTRPKMDFTHAYLPDAQTFAQWFADCPQWLENMQDLLLACNAELPPGEKLMPTFPIENGMSTVDLLKRNCEKGLKKRIGHLREQYVVRLQKELDVIGSMGYADYFLIVEDFMRFAREHGILTGPGRGSSAGSLVAFSLGITDVDPLQYGLIFERFLNPGRITMPDIDIDFADNRRSEVIAYVAKKYGKAHVAQIITFGTLSTKAVARNVARVFDFSSEEMSFISKQIQEGQTKSLEEAVQQSKPLQDWIAMDEIRNKWYEAAVKLEGLPRNASTHAAGVILSPVALVETVPVQNGGDELYLTQWAMGDVEEAGLLKMDFLGLRNLTLMDRIKSMIEHDKSITMDFQKIPLTDRRTFDLFKAGDTTGVFQFESAGMRDALRLIRPETFSDLYAINALYRPGPMDNIPLYSKRKNECQPIEYVHPQLKPILEETKGIIVYQEQIMQIAVHVAGFTFAEADLLRRAVSKKNRDVLEKEKAHFVESAVANGFPKQPATIIYELIVKFADYGFPKSHAVAYSLISYQLAFLKANEPTYFYAALLSMVAGSPEKTTEIMQEIRKKGIHVLPPSVTRSKYLHIVEGQSIRIGLGAIKGISFAFYQQLKTARTAQKWDSMFDFAAAIGGQHFTDKTIQPLIKAGALDEFHENRAVLLASVEAAKNHAMFIGAEDDLLHEVMNAVAKPKYSPAGKMPRLALLEYEREVLGFYLSEHPATEMKKRLKHHVLDIVDAQTSGKRSVVNLLGMIMEVKRIRTKKGEAMAFFTLQDETGEVSCTLFPKQYASLNVHLQELIIVQAKGTVEKRNGQHQLIIQDISPI
ncbi:DNA polymerase III subunit alpha [Sporosarcina sp. OR05]|uniref:DNA polymerase III subunit alpha n=1 Tax=Sporosarcina sp. OR05 TaxID=2969819 RepID=UPI00352AF420